MNHTTLLIFVFAMAIILWMHSTGIQNAQAGGCISTCQSNHTAISDNKTELLFFSLNNNNTKTISTLEKDIPFILPFP